jgi:hypothetical protein
MRVIWPFVAVVALMLLLGHASLQVLSGMRAFANAESARSKSLAVAVSDLEQYAATGSESAYGRFLAGMATGSALRDARTEFARAHPDIDVAKQRLRDAHIHSDDAESIIDGYRRFRGIGYMATTASLWDLADAEVAELAGAGQALRSIVAGGKASGRQPAAGHGACAGAGSQAGVDWRRGNGDRWAKRRGRPATC